MLVKATPTFNRIYKADKRIVCLRGGTRSGKSYAMMQKVVLWLWSGSISGKRIPNGVFSVTRSTLPALKATVLSDFISYLHELNIYQYIAHIKTTNEFVFKSRKVVFFSLDDEHKLRGRAHDFIWINECTDTTFTVFNQAIMRLNHQMFLDYNPQGEPWVKTEIEDKRLVERGDVHLDVSVYTDNPFLHESLVEEIVNLEKVDNSLWRIYTKGEWVSLEGLIYPNHKLIEAADWPNVGKVYYGMDFGYNHYTALTRVLIDGDNIYLRELVYERGLLINDLVNLTQAELLPHEKVYCDSAEPRTIEELRRRGINARAAKKGADSVRQGIAFIKQHHIYVTSDSLGIINELQRYKWAADTSGKLLDKPIDAFDDGLDSVRYAVSHALKSKLKLL